MIHVLPNWEGHLHLTDESTDCEPTPEFEESSGEMIVVHNEFAPFERSS